MWRVHVRPDHVGCRVHRGRTHGFGRRDPRVDEREPVPMRVLSEHRRRDPGRRQMRNFTYAAPRDVAEAVRLAGQPDTRFIAGGTDLLNLMKDGAENYGAIIDINALPLGEISQRG